MTSKEAFDAAYQEVRNATDHYNAVVSEEEAWKMKLRDARKRISTAKHVLFDRHRKLVRDSAPQLTGRPPTKETSPLPEPKQKKVKTADVSRKRESVRKNRAA